MECKYSLRKFIPNVMHPYWTQSKLEKKMEKSNILLHATAKYVPSKVNYQNTSHYQQKWDTCYHESLHGIVRIQICILQTYGE